MVPPVAVLGALVGYGIASILRPTDGRWLLIGDTMGQGFAAALTCMLLVSLGRRRLSSIGITARRFFIDVGLGLAAWVAAYLALLFAVLALIMLHPGLLDERPAAQRAIEESFPRLKLWEILLLCVGVAVYEEIVFRGFLLTRLLAIVRRWWLAVPIGTLAFGLMHFRQGGLAVAVVCFLGAVMSMLFVWRRSLVAPITMHVIHNVLMFSLLKAVSESWK